LEKGEVTETESASLLVGKKEGRGVVRGLVGSDIPRLRMNADIRPRRETKKEKKRLGERHENPKSMCVCERERGENRVGGGWGKIRAR